ncbi:hypothetical protein C8J57DRAFT_1464959 [Mycena rebaudengoi]|nr:hypothetical protein C8J57DRAFT_1464959 [Mycena rebaudengoi]
MPTCDPSCAGTYGIHPIVSRTRRFLRIAPKKKDQYRAPAKKKRGGSERGADAKRMACAGARAGNKQKDAKRRKSGRDWSTSANEHGEAGTRDERTSKRMNNNKRLGIPPKKQENPHKSKKKHSPPRNTATAAGGSAPASVAPLSSSAFRALAFRGPGTQRGVARVSAPRGDAGDNVGVPVGAVDDVPIGPVDGAADDVVAADGAGAGAPATKGPDTYAAVASDSVISRSASYAGVRRARASVRVPTGGSGLWAWEYWPRVPRPRQRGASVVFGRAGSVVEAASAFCTSARPPAARPAMCAPTNPRSVSAASAGGGLCAREGGGGEEARGEVEVAEGREEVVGMDAFAGLDPQDGDGGREGGKGGEAEGRGVAERVDGLDHLEERVGADADGSFGGDHRRGGRGRRTTVTGWWRKTTPTQLQVQTDAAWSRSSIAGSSTIASRRRNSQKFETFSSRRLKLEALHYDGFDRNTGSGRNRVGVTEEVKDTRWRMQN